MSAEGVKEVSGDIARIASRKRKILLGDITLYLLMGFAVFLESMGLAQEQTYVAGKW